jgi:ubiquinone/menaquinone biosynthesis C-methylase UbiE
MFFKEKIKSIKPSDRVLEIGPGSSPFHRSNAFLEIKLATLEERILQRGEIVDDPDYKGRPVYYYDGGVFPFANKEFDYIICSHVIEHVDDPDLFVSEIFRVGGGRGYLEYPMITYEYLYDFDVHKLILKFDTKANNLQYVKKRDLPLSIFSPVTALLRKSLDYHWDDLCSASKNMFFEGFEFSKEFKITQERDLTKLVPNDEELKRKSFVRRAINKFMNMLKL